MATEIAIYDHGTIVQFEPLSDLAVEWFDEHVLSEPWQWIGGRLCVDHRLADDLATGIREAGFSLSMS